MTEQLGQPRNFDILKDKATIPNKPAGLDKGLERIWERITGRWDIGLEHFELLKKNWPARVRLDTLGQKQRHRATADFVMNIIGMSPSSDRVERALRKKLVRTRRCLGLGREDMSTPGIFLFTSEEIVQLMVGYLAQFNRTDDINRILYGPSKKGRTFSR